MTHYVLDQSNRQYWPEMFPGIVLAPGNSNLACGEQPAVWAETTDIKQVTCPKCIEALKEGS